MELTTGVVRAIARLSVLLALGTGSILSVQAESVTEPLSRAQPNVLLIILDDVNDFVGPLGGHPQAFTPNIDTLARRGISFTNAHTPVPQCHAARVSLLTGISPARSKLRSNRHRPWRDFLPDAVSLPQAFHAAGYLTAGYGKIFHYDDPGYWDIFINSEEDRPRPAADRIPLHGIVEFNVRNYVHDWGPVDVAESNWQDHRLAGEAIEFIRTRDPNDSPFLLTYGATSTHTPWYVPPAYYELIAGGDTGAVLLPPVKNDDLDDVGKKGRTAARAQHWRPITGSPAHTRMAVHSYLAAMAMVDRQVGRILDALDASPFAANTVVVLLSDHGLHFGEKRSWGKLKLWEESTRVPLIIRLPRSGNGPAPGGIQRPVSIAAVFATLLELTGIPLPAYPANDSVYRVDYRGLGPLMRAPQDPGWGGPAVTFGRRAGQIALRTEHFRYIRNADGFEELYDHSLDPNEWRNLSDVAEHRERLAQWSQDADSYLGADHRPFGYPGTSMEAGKF